MRTLLVMVVVLAAGARASADSSASVGSGSGSIAHVGVMTDVGLPDAGSLSLVIRPVRDLRVDVGAGYNGVGPGVRGGLTWALVSWWVTPTVSVGGGKFFEGNANGVARVITSDAGYSSPLLDRVGYDYEYARLGLEFGRGSATFFIHAGFGRMTGDVHDIAEASTQAMSTHVSISSSDAQVAIWGASADLGLIFYL